jgi:hypothetical protein
MPLKTPCGDEVPNKDAIGGYHQPGLSGENEEQCDQHALDQGDDRCPSEKDAERDEGCQHHEASPWVGQSDYPKRWRLHGMDLLPASSPDQFCEPGGNGPGTYGTWTCGGGDAG